MEPPSPPLAATLWDLRLATPRDVRRAARWCRSIARDLPTFDCVWIDALLREGLLTPFQAAHFHEGTSHRLRRGPFVVSERFGGGHDEGTLLARSLDDGSMRVIQELQLPPERHVAVRGRFEELCEAGAAIRSSNIVAPESVLEDDGRLIIVSRDVKGARAGKRLVRFGRISGIAVAEIARQLLEGLAEAHAAGLPHGDIRISNLVLTPRGDAVLVRHGIRAAVSPILTIDDSHPPEWFDGTAPERIGTAAPASAEADVYALGCLLWHLLAGRPPFATGDSLEKLAAHRSRPVPDVRDFAPDAPPELTRLISAMTDRDPTRRPTDLAAARQSLRRAAIAGRANLRKPGVTAGEKKFPWALAAALLFALSGASLSLFDLGASTALLKTTFGGLAVDSAKPSPESADGRSSFASLPPPDENGVLTLEHPGPFTAGEVAFRGPLVLRGQPERPATIVVSDRPLHLWADDVALEHVRIVYEPSSAAVGRPSALVLVEAQNLAVRSCRFGSAILPSDQRTAAPAALAWRLVDRADPTAGRIQVRDSVFRGTREALFVADRARRLAVENVLAVGQRSLISLGAGGGETKIFLEHVTLRDARSVLSCRAGQNSTEIEVAAEHSILDLGPTGALFAEPTDSSVRWSGIGVVSPRSMLREARTTAAGDPTIGPATEGVTEGVTRAEIAFAGPADGSDAAAVARVSGTPRLAGQTPGIDLSRLPREPVGAVGPR